MIVNVTLLIISRYNINNESNKSIFSVPYLTTCVVYENMFVQCRRKKKGKKNIVLTYLL